MLFSSSLRSPAAAAGNCRLFHSSRRILGSDALIVGVSSSAGTANTSIVESLAASKIIPSHLHDRIQAQLDASHFDPSQQGQVRMLYGLDSDNSLPPILSIVSLGKPSPSSSSTTTTTPTNAAAAAAETARTAAANSINAFKSLSKTYPWSLKFTALAGSAQGCAEGVTLATFTGNDTLKTRKSPVITCTGHGLDVDSWDRGILFAQAQNKARELADMPGNHLTPTLFAQYAESLFTPFFNNNNLSLSVHDKTWAASLGMNSFLSVARGSDEEPKFLEIAYKGNGNGTGMTALVGKGVTFDSGGISIKPSANMDMMKGDMMGASVVLSTMWAAAKLQLPINLVAAIPLTENMPSGRATKPGDVIRAMNGKTIEIDNTDAEGRLILADAMWWVKEKYGPSRMVELSTMTGAMDVALGGEYAGVFTTHDALWDELRIAGLIAGDKFWRMPLDSGYRKLLDSQVADMKNTGRSRSAGSCTAAIFLKEFLTPASSSTTSTTAAAAAVDQGASPIGVGVEEFQFAHIDIAGVMHNSSPSPAYLAAGMTGRPTRSMISFVSDLAAAVHVKK